MDLAYYDPYGRRISFEQAERLLMDIDARRIAETIITTDRGSVEVSTVSLTTDHGYLRQGPPILWETMIFEGPDDLTVARYASRKDAIA